MKITCLHTAEIHVSGFAAQFEKAAWEGALDHVVRPDLLVRAQDHGTASVADDLAEVIAAIQADAVLCTCSTLGPLIDAFGRSDIVRIDRPAMEAAAQHRHVMLALCLDCARAPSLSLFGACAAGADPTVVMCTTAWPHFERGDMAAFYRDIAQTVGAAVIDAPQTDCMVLGQASMQGAAPVLLDIGLPVLTTPTLAVGQAIKIARR